VTSPPPPAVGSRAGETAVWVARESALAGVALSAGQVATLLDYARLLERWRRLHNLVGARSVAEILGRHVLDSLAAVPLVRGTRVLDLGTGAGLPGLPVAVACPQRRVTLLDASAKRTRFLVHAVPALGLSNVEVVRARAETYNPHSPFDTVLARGVAELPALVRLAGPLLAAGGQLLALKGELPPGERVLGAGFRIDDICAVHAGRGSRARCVVRVIAEPDAGSPSAGRQP